MLEREVMKWRVRKRFERGKERRLRDDSSDEDNEDERWRHGRTAGMLQCACHNRFFKSMRTKIRTMDDDMCLRLIPK